MEGRVASAQELWLFEIQVHNYIVENWSWCQLSEPPSQTPPIAIGLFLDVDWALYHDVKPLTKVACSSLYQIANCRLLNLSNVYYLCHKSHCIVLLTSDIRPSIRFSKFGRGNSATSSGLVAKLQHRISEKMRIWLFGGSETTNVGLTPSNTLLAQDEHWSEYCDDHWQMSFIHKLFCRST